MLLGAVSCILFVPGLKTENSKPFVIPALQEWKGGDGYWRSLCRLVLDSRYAAELNPVANGKVNATLTLLATHDCPNQYFNKTIFQSWN